jgi:hypothetical protein
MSEQESQHLDLYRARLYGGRALSQARLEEFQRASDRAAARLGQAREESASRSLRSLAISTRRCSVSR